MKQRIKLNIVMLGLSILLSQAGFTQIGVASIIQAGIKKVIMAVDLKIQRLQNKTIWLQNAQKKAENILSKARLSEISDWVQKQKDLYSDYFNELWRVKNFIAYYHRVKEIIEKQTGIVKEYEVAFKMFKTDKHFSSDEIDYMQKVYDGIINASLKNLTQLSLVVNSFSTQTTDENRIEIINKVADSIDNTYNDLKAFDSQNKILSLQRSKDFVDINTVKKLYGL